MHLKCKKTFAFWRAARGRGWGIFERFGVLSLWKGIGYVLRLFPFCSGLEAEFVPARDAGSEARGWGTLSRGAGGGETKSLCGALGGPVGRPVR